MRTVARLRWRLARLLVGPFVQVPDRDGVWIVMRTDRVTVTWEADKFRLDAGTTWGLPNGIGSVPGVQSWGDFEGTVKRL